MKFFSIQAVSEMCGLSAHCIRAWEKRYNAVSPVRSENGRRLYSEEDLHRLKLLGKLSSLGNTISLIAGLSTENLEALLSKMTNEKNFFVKESQAESDPKAYLDNLFLALNAYKIDVLTHELNKSSQDLSPAVFALEVVLPLVRRVGEYVQSGRMSIAQEHTLSALVKFFVGKRISTHYESEKRFKLKVTLATPQEEFHSIGLLLSCLIMTEYDVEILYLGENLPLESIAEAARAIASDVVLMSVSPAYHSKVDINKTVMDLHRELPSKTKIWLGGSLGPLSPETRKNDRLMIFQDLLKLKEHVAQVVRA